MGIGDYIIHGIGSSFCNRRFENQTLEIGYGVDTLKNH